jgi:hypothetical protein
MTFHLNTTIKAGSHKLPSEGSCTMEIACLAGGFGWRGVKSENYLPKCMSRVIGAYVIWLNDAMPDDQRQRLMAFVPRLTSTRGTDAEERARAEYLVMNAGKPAAVVALRSAGLGEHADAVAAAGSIAELEKAVRAAAETAAETAAVWAARAARAAATATAATARARAVAWAAAWAAEGGQPFDWTPYLDALDGALRIGPQADMLDAALIEERTRVLVRA